MYLYVFPLRRTRSSGVVGPRRSPHRHGRGVLLTWWFWKDSGSRENRFLGLTSSIFLFPVQFTRRSSGNLMGGRYYAYVSARIDERFKGNSSPASVAFFFFHFSSLSLPFFVSEIPICFLRVLPLLLFSPLLSNDVSPLIFASLRPFSFF